MKKIIISAVLLLCAAFVVAEEQEHFSLPVGGVKLIELPFAFESYRASAPRVEVEEVSKQQLRIIGKSLGECNLIVSGGGVSRNYNIKVTGNISNVLKRLRADLDGLPELEPTVNQDYIVIRGTVTDPEHWAHLKKVLAIYNQKEVHNFAVFRPAAETILKLQKMLEDAGFRVVTSGSAKTGELLLQTAPDAITLTGELYSANSITKVRQILSTQTWLSTGGAADKGLVRGIINLSVVETQLQVDIVYVGITETETRSAGSGTPVGKLNLSGLYDIVTGRGNGTATFGGDMNATIKFLADNGVSRIYNAGHVSFVNGGKSKLHTGGTLSVKVTGADKGDGQLKDLDYGLTIEVSGRLISPTRVQLDLEIINTSSITRNGSDAFDQAKTNNLGSVICDLEKTMVLGGARRLLESTGKAGFPVLRNMPVIQWFVSNDSNDKTDMRLLILACPRIVKFNPDVQINIPLEKETAPVYRDAKRDNKVRQEENRRYRGILFWLNWFSW